ncbi:hypothetical protein IU403_01005 [Aerococcaceae bacterium zg-BR22]|uniref:hypothetical protein n=1 Tax=Aerococcaceae bacterium zg-1292 TaxID=2774330 RepID=UPI0040645FCF|nr:hypothetical protein [Aerococcaceae bacterium zg-BR22]
MMGNISIIIFIVWVISSIFEEIRKNNDKTDLPEDAATVNVEVVGKRGMVLGRLAQSFNVDSLDESELSSREESSMTTTYTMSQPESMDVSDDYYDAQEAASLEYYNTLEFSDSEFDSDLDDVIEVQSIDVKSVYRSAFSLNANNIREAIIASEILSSPKARHIVAVRKQSAIK